MSGLKTICVVLFAAFLCGACSRATNQSNTQPVNTNAAPQQSQISSTTVVKITSSEIALDKGSADGLIHVKIDAGYHVNANPPSLPYLKATELEILPSQGFTVGFITYPDPITKKFKFADKPLAVYEGDTTIKVHLKADKNAKIGQNLSAKLRVQACDEQVCYAPGEISFVMPVNAK